MNYQYQQPVANAAMCAADSQGRDTWLHYLGYIDSWACRAHEANKRTELNDYLLMLRAQSIDFQKGVTA